MRMLVIGGCHTYGYGLRPGKSFVEQFGRRLQQVGEQVNIDYFTPFDLPLAGSLVRQLDLDSYELIVLQLGNYRLQHPSAFTNLLKKHQHTILQPRAGQPPKPASLEALRSHSHVPFPDRPSMLKQIKSVVKLLTLKVMAQVGQVGRLTEMQQQLADLLHYLQPHRRKVVLLTPFPHLDMVSRWLREQGRALFRQIGQQKGVHVLDTHLYICPQKQYFMTDDSGHLNAIGHELIGLYLFDFYQNELRERLAEAVL
ncbi:SGNH/GDSL hydrolase family protein [Larkinella rosea]|uniref:SGNH/GDSL hydrolase family protein n=1 Tax=Larkinella rosea TaxID=2025312 RepID=A0A3P1BUB1_9BACT|nr:SGNH/GDSL hydrolase family protein [Larkinella rosea]RRB04124.1 SGNH/GDSL hydrolase family protein [Larkinella rosea]